MRRVKSFLKSFNEMSNLEGFGRESYECSVKKVFKKVFKVLYFDKAIC